MPFVFFSIHWHISFLVLIFGHKKTHMSSLSVTHVRFNAPDSIVLYPPYSSKKEFPPPNASNPVKFSGVEVFCGAAAGEETGGVS